MTKLKNELVPKRRFEEFNGDWYQEILGEVVEITMGQSPNSANYTDNPSNHILVQGNADLKNNKVVPRVWTTEITKMAKKDDLILSVRAPVGDIGKTDYEVVLGRGVAGIHGNEFIYQLLTKMKKNKYWDNLSTGSTFESINSHDIKLANILIPDAKEQQKIGQFFKHLDEMIALQQREIDKTKALKSAYLAEMFPAEGEHVPKRRFEGFTDEWKPLKLIEFVDKAVDNRGKTPPLNINGSHPLIEVTSIGDGPPDYSKVEKYLDDSSFQNNLRDYIKKNDILFSTVGRIGLVSLMDEREDAAIAQNIVAFRAKESYVPEYIYALFSTEQSKIKAHRIVMGAVQPSIKVSQLIHNEYYLPTSRKEQKQIGNFFKHLDDTILIHQQKLEKLKATKQAYLHEMFV